MTRPYDNIELIDTEIVAAKQSVNRSKRFDRSAKEHLEQHQHWLEQYVAQEARDKRETRAPAQAPSVEASPQGQARTCDPVV